MSAVMPNTDLPIWSSVFQRQPFSELFLKVLVEKLASILESTGKLTQEQIGALGIIVNMVDRQVVFLKSEKERTEETQEMIRSCKQTRVAAIFAMIVDAKEKSLETDLLDI